MKQTKYSKCEPAKLAFIDYICDALKSARVHKYPLPHPLCNTYRKENAQVSSDFTSN